MINIRIVSFNGEPPTQASCCDFDELGGTIGRAETNQLVLTDPDRHVSRLQARVCWRNDRFELINLGSNPVGIGERTVANGNAMPIQPGDRIEIAGFVLEVAAAAAAPETGAPELMDKRRTGPIDDPLGLFGDTTAGTSGGDPFADLLRPREPAASGPSAPARSSAGTIPDDFDPAADPFASPPAPENGTSLDDLGFAASGDSGKGQGISTMFGLRPSEPAGTADPFAGGALAEPLPGAQAGRSALDPLAPLLGTNPSGPDRASVPDQVPEIRGAYRPPPAVAGSAFLSWEESARSGEINEAVLHPRSASAGEPEPTPLETPVAAPSCSVPTADAAEPVLSPVAPTSEAAADTDALTRALLAGLGIADLPLPDGVTPEVMERVGRLLRESMQGTLDLLLARSLMKREVRADVTIIAGCGNNPLKFSPNVEAALAHLLAPRGRGFLPPVEAVRDAYDDLRSHQLGFMAGLRAALGGVLARFDPAALEERLREKSALDSLLPMSRRAGLWRLYTELYRDVAREAEDDFHALFGREFLRAYEEQVARTEQRED